MENWGLITFKEATLLVDPKSAAIKDEMNVARVIAHELGLIFKIKISISLDYTFSICIKFI